MNKLHHLEVLCADVFTRRAASGYIKKSTRIVFSALFLQKNKSIPYARQGIKIQRIIRQSLQCFILLVLPGSSYANFFFDGSTLGGPSILPGFGVEVTIGEAFASTTSFDPQKYGIDYLFNVGNTGLAADTWSTGDIIRITMGGNAFSYDFDNPGSFTVSQTTNKLELEHFPGSSGFDLYNSNLFDGGTFTFEVLAGDGVKFDGFQFDENTGSRFNQYLAQEATHGTVFAISSVPLPPAVWLFGTGLMGLLGSARYGRLRTEKVSKRLLQTMPG